MGTKTEHYQLNQWEPTDDFLRTDFNEDNAKIENALTDLNTQIAGVGYILGSYSGNGTYPRTIELGFQPKAVLLFSNSGETYVNGTYGGLFGTGYSLGSNSVCAQVTETGFILKAKSVNTNGSIYHYLAFR